MKNSISLLGGLKMKKNALLLFFSLALALGCASSGVRLTRDEIYSKFKSIASLDQSLAQAKANEVDIFAPKGFVEAKDRLAESIEFAHKGDEDQAGRKAKKGLEILKKAETDAENAKQFMWEVNGYRERTRKSGAPQLFKEEYGNVEKMLREACVLFEHGKINEAKDRRPALLNTYSKLEIRALKEGTLALAKAAFEQAKYIDADEYAPKTFQLAKKELNLAISTLKMDPTNVDEANEHAELASALAKKACELADLARIFERRKYSHEDILLWYWQQLTEINEPFESKLDFEQPNRTVIRSLHNKISSLVESQHIAESIRKGYEEKERRQRIANQKFEYVQSLFHSKEAQVYRKGDNILISASGFYFPSGGAEILAQNYELLNKIVSAIRQFPGSRLEISGHTDAIGHEEINLPLSRKRAENIAKFLVEVGNIESANIITRGYGESRPVASNETAEGRGKNRRIELMIIND
jgi:OOP family OmpA-OmpF porin